MKEISMTDIKGIQIGQAAVSYTHLDVYKRQVIDTLVSEWLDMDEGGCLF